MKSNPKPITVTYHLEAGAGAEGYETVYIIPNGRIFQLEKSEVDFPSGTAFELLLALNHGIHQVAPAEGKWRGDGFAVTDYTRYRWLSDEKVLLYYKNLNTTMARKAQVTISGLLE